MRKPSYRKEQRICRRYIALCQSSRRSSALPCRDLQSALLRIRGSPIQESLAKRSQHSRGRCFEGGSCDHDKTPRLTFASPQVSRLGSTEHNGACHRNQVLSIYGRGAHLRVCLTRQLRCVRWKSCCGGDWSWIKLTAAD